MQCWVSKQGKKGSAELISERKYSKNLYFGLNFSFKWSNFDAAQHPQREGYGYIVYRIV